MNTVEPKKKADTVAGRDCTYCHFCGELIQSHVYETGYGGGSSDWQTHKPFSNRRFVFPEGSLSLKVCSDCEDKPSSKLIHAARIKAVKDELEDAEQSIKTRHQKISKLQEEIEQLEQIITRVGHYLCLLEDKQPVEYWDKIKMPHELY